MELWSVVVYSGTSKVMVANDFATKFEALNYGRAWVAMKELKKYQVVAHKTFRSLEAVAAGVR